MANDRPVYLAILIDCRIAGQAVVVDLCNAGIVGQENGRGAVRGLDGYADDIRVVDAVGQEEISVVLGQLLKGVLRAFVDGAHADAVLFAADHAAAAGVDRAAQRTVLKLVGGGRIHAAQIDRPVQGAGLGRRNVEINIGVLDRSGAGIAGSKRGAAVIRRGKVNILYFALILASVHQYGGKHIRGIDGQAGNALGQILVGVADGDVAASHDICAVAGRIDQVGSGQGTVAAQADRPVQRAGFIGLEGGLRLIGSEIVKARIAAQDAGKVGHLLAERTVHNDAVNIGCDAGADMDDIRQHLDDTAGRVDIQYADIALAADGGRRVKVQHLDRRALRNGDFGADSVFVNGQLLHRTAADSDAGVRSHGDDLVDIARQVELRAVLAVHLDVLEAIVAGGAVFQIGVSADVYTADIGIADRPDGDILVGQAVHDHFGRGAVFQDNTAIALVTFARAAGNDAAIYGNIVQRDISEADTACDIQVAGHCHVFQRYARGRDHQIAGNAVGVGAGSLHRCADHADQHDGNLAACDVVQRTEGSARVAAQDALFHCGLDIAAAPAAGLPAVGKGKILAGKRLKQQVAA